MKRVTYLRNWSSRVKNAAMALFFLTAYSIGSIAPFVVSHTAHAQAYDTGWKVPTAAQPAAGWSNSAATVVQSDDNNYTTNNTGATQGYGSFNFGIPSGAQVTGIAVSTNAKSTDNNGCRLAVRLSWDGGSSTTSPEYANLTDVEANYILGGSANTWGHVWTPTELNSSAFLSLLQDNDPGNNCTNDATTSVDALSVRVYYDVPVQPLANPALAQACGLDIAIVIDNSTSIDESEMAQMKSALTSFTNALSGTPTEFSVTRFASSASVLQPFTSNVSTVNAAINGVPTGGGYTNWEDGLLKAGSTLPNRSNPNLVIFATDGDPTTSNTVGGTDTGQPNAHLEPAVVAANSIKNSGTRILALGIGLGGDAGSVSRLKQISGPNADTGSVLTSDVITTSFSTLAQALATFAAQTCGGTITTQKLIDADGNPATTADQTPAAGWVFDINGGSNPAPVTTDGQGLTPAVKVDADSGYSVNETAQAGYRVVAASCTGAAVNGTWNGNNVSGLQINANNVVRCTFVNALKKGHITVHKVTNPASNPTTFSVTASGSGVITEPATRNLTTATDAVYEVSYGTYAVEEAQTAGWAQTGTTCDVIVVNDNNPNPSCTITNTKLAKLKIVKDALPNDAQDFTFTTSGTGLSGFNLDDDSDGTLSNQKEFTNLIPGSYAVTEQSVGGWQLTGLTCDTNNFTVAGAQVSVLLAAGQETTCTYTNSKLGSLGGYKYEVNADNSIVTPASGWIITLFKDGVSTGQTQTTGADGSYSFGSLLPGDYSVSETLLGGWTQVYSPLSPVSLAAGQTATDQNFGNFKNGSISGYKFNDHNGNGVEDSGDEHLSGWTISLAKEADGTMTLITYVATDGDGNYSFTNLAPGTYWICETGKTGWVQTYPTNNACHKVIIDMSGEQNTAVKFGNQGQGTITVQKNVDADGDGQVDYTNVGDWQWDAGGEDEYATGTTQTFAAGSYVLTETQKANYHFTSVICSDDESGVEVMQAESFDVILAPGQNITCVFTNTRDTAFVKVTKNIYPTDDQGLFNLLVDGTVKKQDATNGDATDWVRVVTGSHSLSEVAGTATDMSHYDSRYTCWQDYREGMTYNSDLPAFGDGTSVDVSVATGQYVICNFYNERHATLTIEKDAEPNDSQDFNFTLWSVDMKGFRSESTSPLALQPLDFQTLDAPGTISPLESFVLDDDSDPTLSNNASYELSGAWYGVTEDATDGWDLTNITCGEGENKNWYVDDTTGVLYIWLEPGSDNSCTFTNTKRAHVTVHKDAQPDYAQAFNFTTDLTGENSSFSLTDNGVSAALASSEFANVVPGTYTVTEDAVSGWTLSGVSCTGAEMLRDGAKITIDVQPGADVDCTFVNQKNTIPQVLGETTQPKLEDTGSSIWVAIGMSLSVMGLALLTVTSGRRRDQWTGLVE